MSEFPTFNLALGIIGTLTGAIALIISYITYRREKPNLKIEVLESKYNFTHNPSEKTHINFWTKFQVRNLGDRGTRIYDIGLSFRVDSKDYSLKKEFYLRVPLKRMEAKQAGTIWLGAHDRKCFQGQFVQEYDSTEKEQIDCIFTIWHTHGSQDAKFTSVVTETHNL
jgi:hypothetical protein